MITDSFGQDDVKPSITRLSQNIPFNTSHIHQSFQATLDFLPITHTDVSTIIDRDEPE